MRECSIILIITPDGNEVLLGIKHDKGATYIGHWLAPSETGKPWEKNPWKTARRGLKEEAKGAIATDLRHVGTVELIFEGQPDRNRMLSIFRTPITGWPKNGRELRDFRWFKVDDLPDTWPDGRFWMRRAALHQDIEPFGLRITMPAEPVFQVRRFKPQPIQEATA